MDADGRDCNPSELGNYGRTEDGDISFHSNWSTV